MILTVFDTESDGLLDEATRIHCACLRNNKGERNSYTRSDISLFLDALSLSDIIVAHNAIPHDLPLLKKLYGWKYNGIVVDSLVFSRLLQPERVGRHSIEAWGERFGVPKPVHEDWSTYSPEMLHRCEQDVEINWLILEELLKESELTMEELCQMK